jgi:hypothetical protein
VIRPRFLSAACRVASPRLFDLRQHGQRRVFARLSLPRGRGHSRLDLGSKTRQTM